MTNILNAPVHPDAATAFVRRVPEPSGNTLSQFLPDKTIQDTRVEVTDVELTSSTAPYRSYDGNIPRIKRDGFQVRQVEMLPMSLQGGKGEFERLQLEKVRQTGGSDAAIVEAIYNDLEKIVLNIRNALEVYRGKLLSTGRVTVAENGVFTEADFGVPAEHFVGSDVAWTDVENARPITDLIAWSEVYANSYGQPAGGMIVSRKTMGLLRANKEIRAAAGLTNADGPAFVSNQVVNAALAAFDLPPVVAVYDQVINGQRVIPEGKVIFVPANAADLGNTYWGVSATALELLNAAQTDMSFSDAPGLVGVVIKSGPPFQEAALVDSINLPILNNPKALLVADVTVNAGS
ncbi:capsid protein [Gordonia phage OneUp]|uniref:Capsid protein n=2 Tax=Oneupvirus TaxID=2733200 RepID=A0A160DHB5_9CAUD|nr:capsid protein [Gordonia phage OneUp]YP_009820537.1 major capsid protein [Gordonia phage BrutonGaster]ANA86364.1 capsid protein [Gordonia phage OneUp]QBP33240.1 major capsid protein [Gordonia phage BrutonGaster]